MKDLPSHGPDDDALRQQFFAFLLEHAADQIYFKDKEGKFICASRAVAEFMGVSSPTELIGKSDFDFWSEQTAREAGADERRIMETGQPLIGKVERLVYPSGRVTWDYTTKLPLRNAAGEVIGIFGVNRDFTAIKRMEDALEEERNRLRITTAELAAKNAELEADLRMAREVQLALLPREYPNLNGQDVSGYNPFSFAHYYRPAAAVGGDFFDYFPLSQNRVGIFICDVMGHGLRAALVTAIIRALLEELRPVMANAGRFLSSLNLRLRAILERVEEPFVATAFYLIVDSSTKDAQFANAAHPVPVRLSRSTPGAEAITEDKAKIGPALGIFDEITYPTFTCPFEPRDCLVLFTDGLYEVDSPEGKEFGKSALISSLNRLATLPVEKLFPAIVHEVCRFSARENFDDDVCMVAVERKHNIGQRAGTSEGADKEPERAKTETTGGSAG
ncbi:MAG: SpoIIE family protein phosphatase [Chthoniobacterales bacterium]